MYDLQIELNFVESIRCFVAEFYRGTDHYENVIPSAASEGSFHALTFYQLNGLWGIPGMATAGMGDVLSGMIGGLMSQGLPAFEAAGAGVWLHASAGDLIAENSGAVGMLASDLIRQVPHLKSRLG